MPLTDVIMWTVAVLLFGWIGCCVLVGGIHGLIQILRSEEAGWVYAIVIFFLLLFQWKN